VGAVAHAMYGASFLSMLLNIKGNETASSANSVRFSNYFEPINEGAIQVPAAFLATGQHSISDGIPFLISE
jgi:hypothetical protein